MKKPTKDRVGDFMAGKGFYIVLFLCVAAIGISGYYLFSSLGVQEPDVTVAKSVQVTVSRPPAATVVPQKPAVPTTPVQTAAPKQSPSPKVTAQPSATPTPTVTPTMGEVSPAPVVTSSVFTWPVKGEIIGAFSVDELVLNPTMGDWRTHAGTDIAAELGAQVLAAAGGTVTDLRQDDLMGTTLTIDHGNGVISTYSNLAAVPAVEIGDVVTTGDVIGSVGESAIAERNPSAHLHLEMTKDGLPTDPVAFLPGRT